MMSDSDGGDLSDIDDFDDLDMIMQQVQSEQHQEEEEAERVRHRNYIYRERLEAEARLMADYFGPHPKYPEYYFRKRYRMSRTLFLEIVSGIENGEIAQMDGMGNLLEEIKSTQLECSRLLNMYVTCIFIMYTSKLKYFPGIEVIDTDKGICLNQRKYVLDLLTDYVMLACKPARTPMMSKFSISNEATDVDPILDNIVDYQKLRGKLIYLTNTMLDISYAVHCLSLGIHIIKESGMFLKSYSDADWAKCIFTRKSVTGYCVFINNNLISWKNKKQNTISKSSTEAEYRALASVTSEVIWILKILKDLHIENLLPVSLHCDSNSAIKIAANPVFHERIKHLEIDLHFVREILMNGVVKTKGGNFDPT
ncbi:hypothetical protein Tco_0919396 [Tanacetum coccineum]